MRLSLTTPQGKAKCLHCRKKLARVLFSIRVTSRVRCNDCAKLVNATPDAVDNKGFFVKEVGSCGWTMREYTKVTKGEK